MVHFGQVKFEVEMPSRQLYTLAWSPGVRSGLEIYRLYLKLKDMMRSSRE